MDFAILAYLTLQDIGATGLMQGVKIAGHKAFRPVSLILKTRKCHAG
jgi:hypothetical protein